MWRPTPAHVTTTKVNATSESRTPSRQNSDLLDRHISGIKDSDLSRCQGRTGPTDACKDAATKPTSQPQEAKEEPPSEKKLPNDEAEGGKWLNWLLKSNNDHVKSTSSPPTVSNQSINSQATQVSPESCRQLEEAGSTKPQSTSVAPRRSWLSNWNRGSFRQDGQADEHSVAGSESRKSVEKGSEDTSNSDAPNDAVPPAFSGDGSKTAGWVFWSRDRRADSAAAASNQQHVGEIAVSDTPSQEQPRRTSFSLQNSKNAASVDGQKRPATPNNKETSTLSSKEDGSEAKSLNASHNRKDSVATPKSGRFPPLDFGLSKSLPVSAPNLVLPSCHETFPLQGNSGLLQTLGHFFGYNKSLQRKHLSRTQDVPRLRSALAIGVHGYFPAALFRTVLGQPTGTSIKFADMAAKAISKWTQKHGYDCEVKTAALEGEGRIAERVDVLWKLLLNWIDEIRKADFIMVACHSQGVPVAMMLVAKLVSFGCANSARISICAMAGVSLGPFAEYKSRWMGATAGELFEFSHPNSTVSKNYVAAVETVLKAGIRVVYVGSIDDQLVSLESSTFAPISHPHIYRAVFVDGRIHAPNFLVHLVGFALKLRNLGIQDHGLIREVSGPLAGSLYGGEGHSRIYEDEAIYDLAVEFSLETTSMREYPLMQRPNQNSPAPSNPYILPWAVRGILEEDLVKSDLQQEAQELLRQFDEWKPTTKALKDVKFRLEGIRSKL